LVEGPTVEHVQTEIGAMGLLDVQRLLEEAIERGGDR
jgi:hypothetical protein